MKDDSKTIKVFKEEGERRVKEGCDQYGYLNSPHEAYGLITEEQMELMAEVDKLDDIISILGKDMVEDAPAIDQSATGIAGAHVAFKIMLEAMDVFVMCMKHSISALVGANRYGDLPRE